MAGAHNHPPAVGANADLLTIHHAPVTVGQGVDVFAKVAKTGLVVFNGCIAPAGLAVEHDGVGGRLAARIRREHAAVQVLHTGHPQAAFELAREPAGHADVVRVHVGGKHPGQGALVIAAGKQRAPGGQRLIGAHPGVDHGPAVFVRQAPDVDVVERHGQRHAHPDYTGRDLQHLARIGRGLKRINQRGLVQPFSGLGGIGQEGRHVRVGEVDGYTKRVFTS